MNPILLSQIQQKVQKPKKLLSLLKMTPQNNLFILTLFKSILLLCLRFVIRIRTCFSLRHHSFENKLIDLGCRPMTYKKSKIVD